MRNFIETYDKWKISSSHFPINEGEGLSRRALGCIEPIIQKIAIEEYWTMIESSGEDVPYTASQLRRYMRFIMECHWPNVDKDYKNFLFLWPDVETRTKGRSARRMMKIGKALKKMFPCLTDVEVERAVDEIKRQLWSNDLEVKSSLDPEDFARVSQGPFAEYENVDTNWSKKHQSNSCMRYEFSDQPHHPMEAWGSGDFKIMWTECAKGLIHSRVIVSIAKEGVARDKPQAAPIYCCHERAYHVLSMALEEMGAETTSRSTFKGSVLLAHRNDSHSFYGPYVDCEPRNLNVITKEVGVGKKTTEEFLLVESNGLIDGSNYGGVLHIGTPKCCTSCEEPTVNGERRWWGDDVYCEDCYDENFFSCEHCGDEERVESSDWVNVRTYGVTTEERWCSYCISNNAVEVLDGSLWSDQDVIPYGDPHNGEYIPEHLIGNGYFLCHLSDYAFEDDDMVLLDSGDVASYYGVDQYNLQSQMSGRTAQWVYSDKSGEYVLTEVEEEPKEEEKKSA